LVWHAAKTFERDRERDLKLKGAGYEVLRMTWRALQREPKTITTAIRNLLVT